ncbi:Hsp20 family protein [Halobaculum sp. WSA2]|uniref:Hsp20 family protein n=1 Tax=Halobaculum saliterrae TaxID=2073113 RepID=A0A6B0SUA1_9EURY|nr:Hsp20/alpha crystallin family protein [Halobaculum saliterrae]MXR42434.1 Hsp20 family protein [Halobaculum saliterrae]
MRDDRDDPFRDIFDEIERMMNEMSGAAAAGESGGDAGFGDETHVSVYEEGQTLRLVADLPGVEKDGIDLQCDGRTLTISAEGAGRRFDERVRLPVRVDEHSASASFNNGVLEVTFDALEPSADIDVE